MKMTSYQIILGIPTPRKTVFILKRGPGPIIVGIPGFAAASVLRLTIWELNKNGLYFAKINNIKKFQIHFPEKENHSDFSFTAFCPAGRNWWKTALIKKKQG